MQELDFIYRRKSVRKFAEAPVAEDHLRELIKAAVYAPSGTNAQNWQFVVITDKAKITAIADLVAAKNAELVGLLTTQQSIAALRAKVPYHTIFRDAPVLVLIYAGPYPTVADTLIADGAMTKEEAAIYSRANPGIQNIAAAMENLLLAAASLGYGGCWMTGPTYAAEEITDFIGREKIKAGYFLAAMTPIGVPAAGPSQPPRKPLDEVLTIIK